MFMYVHNTMNVRKVIYKRKAPILLLPVFCTSVVVSMHSVVNVTGSLYQLSICQHKGYVLAIYLINMIEDPLVCQSTLKSCRSVRSIVNILQG
jgi:uncharacterized membrane protein YhfC